MKDMSVNNLLFAKFLAENEEKDNIIPELFKFFNIDCIERCRLEPSRLDSMIAEFNKKTECDIYALEEIITFIKDRQKEVRNRENALAREIQAYVDEAYSRDMSIEQIADALHISYFYMCHIFKDKLNLPISVYRTQKRLTKAVKMLTESDAKISDIAMECGYNNISYFTEAFTKNIGMSPMMFKQNNGDLCLHGFYKYNDMLLAAKTENVRFLDKNIKRTEQVVEHTPVRIPDSEFKFLHEAAIIEYHGVLYASWYQCPEIELQGHTPICGKRSYNKGETWSELEILCEDKEGKIMYCPPVYGICGDKLYMLVNQMVAPDHIHSLDLYVLNTDTDKFEPIWSKPVPFKLNTNVVILPNGKLMLPGRVAELDGFPNTPAVLISDSGEIDTDWRLVKIADNGTLPDGEELVHPEISVICEGNTLYMFCRNDNRAVPLVYISDDLGESWGEVCAHDIPYISSKVYCGELSDGRHYMICNTDKYNRSKLTAYFTDDIRVQFTKELVLFDKETEMKGVMHYPGACEYDGVLYVIASKGYEDNTRGAVLFKIDLEML